MQTRPFAGRPQILLFLLTHTHKHSLMLTYIFTIAKNLFVLMIWVIMSDDLIRGSKILMVWYHISLYGDSYNVLVS